MTGTLEVYASADGPPSHDLAFEAWMLERAAAGVCCVALCSWSNPVVVLGYGQPADDVDLDWCRGAGIPVLRRLTGGTGVVHRRDLGVSLALPREHPWASGIISLYGTFLDVLAPALRAAGGVVERVHEPRRACRERSPICFEDQLADTLVVAGGRKAVGCAQTRRRRSVMIHAAVLLGLDSQLYARVFRVQAKRVEAALAPAVIDGRWDEVGAAVATGLAAALGLGPLRVVRPPVPAELLEPYATSKWAPVP